MTKIIIMRHGETEENIKGIAQGQLPGNLSSNGEIQATKAAQELKNMNIDYIYSSDLRRAVQTTEILKKYLPGLRVHLSKKIRERNFGDFQGKPYPSDWDTIQWQPGIIKKHGGEASWQVIDRVKSFLKKLLKKYPDKNILLVTHKRIVQTILVLHNNGGLEELQKMSIPKNATPITLEFKEDFFDKK